MHVLPSRQYFTCSVDDPLTDSTWVLDRTIPYSPYSNPKLLWPNARELWKEYAPSGVSQQLGNPYKSKRPLSLQRRKYNELVRRKATPKVYLGKVGALEPARKVPSIEVPRK